MSELEVLHGELNMARQAQADAEFCRELAGQVVAKVAEAVQSLPFEKLKILAAYVNKSLDLVGVPVDE